MSDAEFERSLAQRCNDLEDELEKALARLAKLERAAEAGAAAIRERLCYDTYGKDNEGTVFRCCSCGLSALAWEDIKHFEGCEIAKLAAALADLDGEA